MVFESKNFVKRKASVSIEFVLSALLGIVVLFMVLGLFSNNLEAMTSNSGIKGIFHNSTEQANFAPSRTTYDVSTDNHTVTKAQIEVSIVGDQGLQWFKNQALTTIQRLEAQPNLTEGQEADLAKALTILAITNNGYPPPPAECSVAGVPNQITVNINSYANNTTIKEAQLMDGKVARDANGNIIWVTSPQPKRTISWPGKYTTIKSPSDSLAADKIKNILDVKKLSFL